MSSSIERYLTDLQKALPVPDPRIIEELRAHLEESKERALESGMSAEEAEAEALSRAGSVESVVESIRSEGTPQLSPFLVKAAPVIAAFFALPALIFLIVNLIEVAAGSEGSEGVFGTSLDPWEREVNMLLTLGPIVAFLVMFLTHSNLRFARVTRGFEVSLHLRLKGLPLALTLLALALIVGVASYLIAEDVFCTMETFPIC